MVFHENNSSLCQKNGKDIFLSMEIHILEIILLPVEALLCPNLDWGINLAASSGPRKIAIKLIELMKRWKNINCDHNLTRLDMQTCQNRQTKAVCYSWFLHVKLTHRNKFANRLFIIIDCDSPALTLHKNSRSGQHGQKWWQHSWLLAWLYSPIPTTILQ